MACKSCAERRIRMKQWIAKQLGVEFVDANPPANFQPEQAERPDAQAEGIGQAEAQGAEHRQQGMDADTAVSASPGRVSVPVVRKVGSRKGSARRSRGQQLSQQRDEQSQDDVP